MILSRVSQWNIMIVLPKANAITFALLALLSFTLPQSCPGTMAA
jgi:hypothetical protein